MEYCGCGDLAQKVERYKRRRQYMDEDVIWRYLIQCLKALDYLHEKNICHRDIKVANCFLAEDGSVKVGDMNVSKRLKRGHLQTQIGTPYYMSPEIWNNRPYDATCDIWSLGCMIYELCALRPPFMGDSFPALKRAVTKGSYPSLPKKYSSALSRLIALMLKQNCRERPSAAALLRSPDLSSKLHLDEAPVVPPRDNVFNAPSMMATIKVPHNLQRLQNVLPKPCYPDIRPNSPESWVVSEQNQLPVPPAVPTKPSEAKKATDVHKSDSENVAPIKANVPPKQPDCKPPVNLAPLQENKVKERAPLEDINARIRAYRAAQAAAQKPKDIPYPGYQGRHYRRAGQPSRVQNHRIW